MDFACSRRLPLFEINRESELSKVLARPCVQTTCEPNPQNVGSRIGGPGPEKPKIQ